MSSTMQPPAPQHIPRGKRGKRAPRFQEPGDWAAERGVANRTLWQAWPWTSWLLPVVLFVFLFFGGTGGWEMLFLLLLSPVLLPIYALANVLPRFLMRRAGGFRSSTTLVSIAMIANWWSLILLALSNRGVGDSGSVDSVLGEMFFGVREPLEEGLFVVGWVCLVVSYGVALAGAFFAIAKSRRIRAASIDQAAAQEAGQEAEQEAGQEAEQAAGQGAAQESAPTWRDGSTWVWFAGIAAPALLALAVGVGVAVAGVQTQQVAERQEARWEVLQEELSPIRAAISNGADWTVAGGRAWADSPGWGSPEEIVVTSSWRYVSDEPVNAVEDRALAAARTAGWELSPAEVDEDWALRDGSLPNTRVEFAGERADGARFTLTVDRHERHVDPMLEDSERITETRTRITAETAPERVPSDLWINWRERIPAEEQGWELDPDAYAPESPVRTFGPDEWPSLAKVDSTMFW
ncbi:MAG: hypothetical protein WCY76_08870 [Leucobacter sp.]